MKKTSTWFRQNLSSQSGLSVIELVVAGALLAGASYVAASVYFRSVEDAVLSKNNDAVTTVRRMLDKIGEKSLNSLTIPVFNPQRTLIGNTDSRTLAPVGIEWALGPSSDRQRISRADVPQYNIAGNTGRSTSHDLENFVLEDSGLDVDKNTRSVYLSRCIDREDPREPEDYTFADLNTLRVPYFLQVQKTVSSPDPDDPDGPPIVETVWVPEPTCCPRSLTDGTAQLPDTCPDPSDTDLVDKPKYRYIPIVFVLAHDGSMQTIPAKSERHIVFGAAFQMSADQNPQPSSMMMQTAILYNRCRTTRAGSGGRAPYNCAIEKYGVTDDVADYEYYDEDVVYTFTRKVKAVAGDVTGQSFIRMGTRINN